MMYPKQLLTLALALVVAVVNVHADTISTSRSSLAFVSTPTWTTSERNLLLPPFPSNNPVTNRHKLRDQSVSSSSLLGNKVDRRPDTQRFNNLIYATDDTVQLLRDELKSRLLKAADDYNAIEKLEYNISSAATKPANITHAREQESDQGNYILKLLRKIVRKISRKELTKSSTNVPSPNNKAGRGILSSDSFRQSKLEVGEVGRKIIEMAEQLSLLNPTPIPTLGFKYYGGAPPSKSKLGGKWKLRFTTAADASFATSEKRGIVTTSQVIDTEEGTLTNVVDFEKGKLKGFRVVVDGEPISETTMLLTFKKVQILRKSRFPKLFGEITIRLPSRLIRWLGSSKKLEVDEDGNMNGPYLQLKYLDDTLRMHTTNSGNWFIQTRL